MKPAPAAAAAIIQPAVDRLAAEASTECGEPSDLFLADPVEVSVIVTTHNGAAVVDQQLLALRGQPLSTKSEIVVVDNGSTDCTVAVVEHHRGHLSLLRIVPARQRQGPGYARNVGARVARGRYLMFLDQDDEVAPGYLQAMAAALRSAPVVVARIDHVKFNGKRACRVRQWQSDGLMPGTFLQSASSCGFGIRREVFESVGGFDESFATAEDADFFFRLQLAGQQLTFAGDAVLHYRWKAGIGQHFQQERRWGLGDVLLYKRYRQLGMPRRLGLVDWLRFAKNVLTARSRADVLHCAGILGRNAGRLQGSVRYRVVYL